MTWHLQLDKTRGSRPRCLLLMDGPKAEVAERFTRLVADPAVSISPSDIWLPTGKPTQNPDGTWNKRPANEARLESNGKLLSPDVRRQLREWWLVHTGGANTPNWDIASTCSVDGERGLLLVEAKAHANELHSDGKKHPTSLNGWENHRKIGTAIADAAAAFQFRTGKSWAISRDRHYQLSNRFAWSWKIVSLGVPVVLLYLGFLHANEMTPKESLFKTEQDWQDTLNAHCKDVVDTTCWNMKLEFDGVAFLPLARVHHQPFDPDREEPTQ